MQIITMVLGLLLAVIVSGFLSRLTRLKLPLPLIQIALGAIVSHVAGFDVPLQPDIFFLLFIPPLLFLDGWRMPKDAFFRDLAPVLMLAIGLVIFTVTGMGYLIDWLIPAMPLAVAFALAAILSPTDPVAVSGIAANAPIPSRLMHILEGEALLNDASGLVCFRFAVAAALTGHFSLTKASFSFGLVAGGGILVGTAVACVIGFSNRWLVRRSGEEPAIQILISLLIPFTAYLAAEHVHASGILAAAAAGIAVHYLDLMDRPLAATRMQRHFVWDTVQIALNGVIFVLLGQQLPRILQSVSQITTHASIRSPWRLLGYVVTITIAMTALRFVWVWASLRVTLFRTGHQPIAARDSLWRITWVSALGGVRGAVTLAGILTLPLFMPDGTPFPARDLAILISMGVILLSLLIASIALPKLARGLELAPVVGTPPQETETIARNAAARAAIRRIEQIRDQGSAASPSEGLLRLLEIYRRRLSDPEQTPEEQRSRQATDEVRHLRIEALRAERDELYRLRRSQEINDSLHRRLVREIDLMEAALAR